MNFEELNGKTIEQAFEEFDKENPEVYKLFKRFAVEWIYNQINRSGDVKQVHISSKQVIGRIRWFTSVEKATMTDYKINDAFTAHYARKFLVEHPHYVWWDEKENCEKSVFEVRRLRVMSSTKAQSVIELKPKIYI